MFIIRFHPKSTYSLAQVIFLYRSPKNSRFSIEKVGNILEREISSNGGIEVEKICLPFKEGVLGVLLNLIWFKLHVRRQIPVYITGHVNYIALVHRNTVLCIHDIESIISRKDFRARFVEKIYLTWPLQCAKAVFAVSASTQRNLSFHYGVKSNVIYNFVRAEIVRKSHQLCQHDNIKFLHVGTKRNKRLDISLAIKDYFSNSTLTIVGEVEEKIRNRTDIRNYVNISDQEMEQIYLENDFLLFPSDYEGFGLPIIEAQCKGLHVFANSIEVLKEIGGASVFFCNNEDLESYIVEINRLLGDAGSQRLNRELGYDNVKRFKDKGAVQMLITSILEG